MPAIEARHLQFHARLLGFLYLFSMGVFIAYFVIVSGVHANGDFASTAREIMASESTYRTALAGLLLGSITVFLIGWAFYVLLKPVHPDLALLGLLFRAAEGALVGVGSLIRFAAIETYLTVDLDRSIAAPMTDLLLAGYQASYYVGQLFLALGSTIFFYLLLKSRFVPRALAGFGMASSALLCLQTLTHLVAPTYAAALGMMEYAPMFLTEVGTGLWLLVKGVDLEHWKNRQHPVDRPGAHAAP